MQRYLIHHDDGGTWDLVVDGGVWTVEHIHEGKRQGLSLSAFHETAEGQFLAQKLAAALKRAGGTPF